MDFQKHVSADIIEAVPSPPTTLVHSVEDALNELQWQDLNSCIACNPAKVDAFLDYVEKNSGMSQEEFTRYLIHLDVGTNNLIFKTACKTLVSRDSRISLPTRVKQVPIIVRSFAQVLQNFVRDTRYAKESLHKALQEFGFAQTEITPLVHPQGLRSSKEVQGSIEEGK